MRPLGRPLSRGFGGLDRFLFPRLGPGSLSPALAAGFALPAVFAWGAPGLTESDFPVEGSFAATRAFGATEEAAFPLGRALGLLFLRLEDVSLASSAAREVIGLALLLPWALLGVHEGGKASGGTRGAADGLLAAELRLQHADETLALFAYRGIARAYAATVDDFVLSDDLDELPEIGRWDAHGEKYRRTGIFVKFALSFPGVNISLKSPTVLA